MNKPELDELIMELKANQARDKVAHYAAVARLDARSRWTLILLVANGGLLLLLTVLNFDK